MEWGLETLASWWMSLLLVCSVLTLLYYHYTSTHDHFLRLGVPYMKPTIILGNIGPRMRLKISFHEFNLQLYNHFKGSQFGGFFEGRRPLLLLMDPDLVKAVMVKDFDHFTDRITTTTRTGYLNKSLLNLKGKEWRNVRALLTPAFSSGKLRGMENIVGECSNQMVEFLNNRLTEQQTEFEMKEFTSRYTMEIIGSCAFGVDCSSLKDPNGDFIKIALKFMDVPLAVRYMFFLCLMLCPKLLSYLPFNMVNMKTMDHLANVVTLTKKEREENPSSRRNDLLQLMLDAAHKDSIGGGNVMTDDVLKSQAVLFLLAGFETTSTLLSFACYNLAMNQEIQDRLRKDIDKSLKECDGQCTYDVVCSIPYLEQVLLETLRLYPPAARVDRVCTKEYNLPGTNITLHVGDNVIIPVAGIMQDPDHFEKPCEFNPERFSLEEKSLRNNSMFLAFGMGPRNCIGLRFALMSAKFFIFHLLANFHLSPCSKTQIPLQFDKRNFLLKADGGIWLKIESLKKSH